MRNTTERPEGVEAGCVTLVGNGRERIVAEASKCLRDGTAAVAVSPYGDGRASERIAAALRR